MSKFDLEVLASHLGVHRTESMMTQEKRAQRRLAKNHFLGYAKDRTYRLTDQGRTVLDFLRKENS